MMASQSSSGLPRRKPPPSIPRPSLITPGLSIQTGAHSSFHSIEQHKIPPSHTSSTIQSNDLSPSSSKSSTGPSSRPKLSNLLSRADSISFSKIISPQKSSPRIQTHHLNSLRAAKNTSPSNLFSGHSSAYVTSSNSNQKPQIIPENPSTHRYPPCVTQTDHVKSNTAQHDRPEDLQYLPDPSDSAVEALVSPGQWKVAPTGLPLSFLADGYPPLHNRTSMLSTWTVASNRSSSQEDLSANLASIQLPSRPDDDAREQPQGSSSPVQISDFPLPPSRNSFLKLNPSSPIFSFLDLALLSPTLMLNSSTPPTIPLPPLPTCRDEPDDNTRGRGPLPPVNTCHAPINHAEDTPKLPPSTSLPPHQRLSTLLDTFQFTRVLDKVNHSIDLLDLYLDRTVSEHIRTPSIPEMKSDPPPTTKQTAKRSSSCDSTLGGLLRAEAMTELVDDPQFMEMYTHELSAIDSDGEETSSEIDLHEPLEAMAVRLGYQVETDDASDSDAHSDIARSQDFDDDSDLLDNSPYHNRPVLSRQTQRSQSSLRSNFPQPLKRFKRPVIAEASSSDEEQFDLTLDHRSQRHATGGSERKWYTRRESSESMGTTVSFSTTPSSSQLSYQTNLSTPNSSQAMQFEPGVAGGTIGLGFEMQAPGKESGKKTHHLDAHLPGLPGSTQRLEWLQHGLHRGDMIYDPPSEDPTLKVGEEEPVRGELEPSLFHEPTAINQSPKRIRHSMMRNSSQLNGLRLKPLMLVDRKSRGLSYPNSTSSILPLDTRRVSRTFSHTLSPTSPSSPLNRPSLANISYRSSVSSLIPRSPVFN